MVSKKNMDMIDKVTGVLAGIGGLNWATVGLFGLDLVDKFLGFTSWMPMIIKVVAGVSTVYFVVRKLM